MSNTSGELGSSLGDIPTRPMRVKVLYTFDSDNQTTCLARFSETLNIPAVSIDEQSEVGIIDLHQCIQAVVLASPEILSRLDASDYTIYAFDYSEHNTPLVGQGRLSSLLASAPSQNVSSQRSPTMITGRVCQNMPALFSNGVRETLEVKLRLTPVSKPSQNEYTRNMETLRSMSPATSAGFDPNAWNASLQQVKAHQQSSEYFDFNSLPTDGDSNTLLEDIFGMDSGSSGNEGGVNQPSGVAIAETPTEATFAYNPAFSAHAHSAPGSRAASPMTDLASNTHNENLRHQSFSGTPRPFTDQSRPGSRASVRSEVNVSAYRHDTHISPAQQPQADEQPFEVSYNEDGQARKRAKIIQTDWRGRSSFGARSADLRVTASKAASMHMHRPVARRPAAPGSNLEPPPRVPTPVPRHASLPLQRMPSMAPRSMLRQASTADSDLLSDYEPMSDASPEGHSPADSITAEGTPMDIPSSPPIIPGFNQPQPSSPGLPSFPSRMADSGYMSERGFPSSHALEGLEDNSNRSPDAEDGECQSRSRSQSRYQETIIKIEGSATGGVVQWPERVVTTSEMNVQIEEPGDMNQLPQKMLLNIPPPKRDGSQGPRQQRPMPSRKSTRHGSDSTSPSAESQTPAPEPSQSRRSSLALPPKPLDTASSQLQGPKAAQKQKRMSLQRSQTYNESEAGSPAPSDNEGRPRGPNRSGSGAQRRKIIEQRLQDSLARGEMPQFCAHCGAIETPTWRRLYVKTVDGKPGVLDSVEGEGETIGVEAVETDEVSGEVTKFVIRKSMKKTKDSQPGPGFEDMMVCNPCGLWFNKFRQMRPSEKWGRKATTRRSKKLKRDDGFATDGIEPPSEALFTDQVGPEDAIDESFSGDDVQNGRTSSSEPLPVPTRRPRANSMQNRSHNVVGRPEVGRSRSDLDHIRAVQSSPVRLSGSRGEPIELDLTPKPTRRLLFPSPRQTGELKSLENEPHSSGEEDAEQFSGGKPSTPKRIFAGSSHTDLNIFEAFTHEKENMAPLLGVNDDFTHLFEGSPGSIFKTPLRKTPSKRSPLSRQEMNSIMKTPTPGSRKRKALNESPNAANGANVNHNDFMTSPSSTRYFLRSTPSRLERTPGGRSRSGINAPNGHETSPFSRHAAQMLGDNNGFSDAPFTSPSRHFDFSDLPTFTTPGRELDWRGLDEILNSEFAPYDDNDGMALQDEAHNDSIDSATGAQA